MKKNKMMRIASVLLVAVLLSTCAISGTFAKYVTSETSSDSARVAKWGVVITANGTTFADEYDTDDDNVNGTIAKSVITAGTTGDSVVAPGTTGSMVSMTISGTPEVAVNVSYKATLELEGWGYTTESNSEPTVVTSHEYCPIVFTVNGVTYGTNDTNATNKSATIEELITAVEGAIGAYSKDYAPKQDLSVENTVATPDVSWTWAFHTDDEHDVKDTILGDAAANGTPATTSLTIVTTVTQID